MTEEPDDYDRARNLPPLTRRLYRLDPWLVRALIPARRIGSYVLYDRNAPFYVGRSDTCLQRRLLRHAYRRRAWYFAYDVHHTSVHAFIAECAIYHVLRPQLSNLIHPDAPDETAASCPFCRADWASTDSSRSIVDRTRLSVLTPRRPR